jgi:Cu-Zn family superoxide dismutase
MNNFLEFIDKHKYKIMIGIIIIVIIAIFILYSSKQHFNPETKAHGMPNSGMNHAGDLPNIKSDANGNATYTAKLHGFEVNTGPTGIVGRSVVVHRDPDDYKSQPAGNSGPRIACGLIK